MLLLVGLAQTRTTTRSCRDPETAVISGRQVSAAGRSVSRLPAAAAASSAAGAAAVAAVYPNR